MAYNQIHMLNGDILHNMGYRGQGMVIAVVDAGYLNADVNTVFDSLRNNGQILGTRDFVTPGADVYQEYEHGAEVLSDMGADVPGQMIGTAPKASFWLLRSEDVSSENIIEEYNWVCAAEFADSVGADIISSSLGYTQFDNPAMNHTCADMTGNTAPSSQGANIASSKGIAVIVAAGNEGGSSWTCMSAPADGTDVLAIAAVDPSGSYAYFSSTGIVNGSYIKPNVAAEGENATIANPSGVIVNGSGTSFATPILAGMVACLWQSRPGVDRATLLQAIEESASQYSHPDSLLGYGIPDFSKAFLMLSVPDRQAASFSAYPNPFTDQVTIRYFSSYGNALNIEVFDGLGRRIYSGSRDHMHAGENIFQLDNLAGFNSGIYLVKISEKGSSETVRLVKTK
jgi:subtilisin family serine protease